VMQNFQKRLLGECVDNNGHHLTDTIFKKWILQLKCFKIKLTLAINSLNPSTWGHLNSSPYSGVGRFSYRVFKFWAKLCRSLFKLL
jgi:hypothetical protein